MIAVVRENKCRNGARVCIITPTHIGSTPRVVKEAQALHDAGFDVTVIAVRTLDSVEPRDQSILKKAPWRLIRIDLRSKPQWLLRRLLQSAARRSSALLSSQWIADRAFSAFTPPLLSEAMKLEVDLYIAHYPPALPAAAAAAKRHRARYSFDAEDFHLGDWPDEVAYEADRRALSAIEGRYLPDCDYMTAASPGIAEAYARQYPNAPHPLVVLNVFPLSQAPHAPTKFGTAEPGPSVYWFSQVIGPNRGLECAIEAIGAATTRPNLYLRGNISEAYAGKLMRLAERFDARERLHFLPQDIPERMEVLASAYDLGLAAETGHTRNRAIALTNKLFTYLLAGVPAIMSDIPAHCAFAAEIGAQSCLYSVDDAQELATILDGLLSNPAKLADMRTNAFRSGQTRFNWEAEQLHLVEIVRRVLGTTARDNNEKLQGVAVRGAKY